MPSLPDTRIRAVIGPSPCSRASLRLRDIYHFVIGLLAWQYKVFRQERPRRCGRKIKRPLPQTARAHSVAHPTPPAATSRPRGRRGRLPGRQPTRHPLRVQRCRRRSAGASPRVGPPETDFALLGQLVQGTAGDPQLTGRISVGGLSHLTLGLPERC